MTVFSLISLVACSGGGTLVIDATEGNDTGATTAADDTGSSGDTGGTTDTVDTEDTTPPEPVADITVWDAELIFNYTAWWEDYSCVDESVHETSEPPSEQQLVALQQACPACSAFYMTSPSTTEICGWIPLEEVDPRGLVLGEDWAQVYRFSEQDNGSYEATLLDGSATFDGWVVGFEAVLSVWGTDLDVTGTVIFPETYPEEE